MINQGEFIHSCDSRLYIIMNISYNPISFSDGQRKGFLVLDWPSCWHAVDWYSTESSFQPCQVGVYPIAEQYRARSVTLPDRPSFVLKLSTKHIVDNNNCEVIAVQVGQMVDGLLSQALGSQHLQYPQQDHVVESSFIVVVQDANFKEAAYKILNS